MSEPVGTSLTPGVLRSRQMEADSVVAALGVLRDLPHVAAWQGVALTTSGPSAVRLDSEATGLVDSGGRSVDLETVYELRLWQPTEGDHGEEFRWVAGSGRAVHLSVAMDGGEAGPGERSVLLRPVTYLQHGEPGTTAPLTALEVFVADERFGNVEAHDEITTGSLGGF